MTIIAAIASSVIGIITIAVAMVISKHMSHLPSMTHPWLGRLNIILMYCGGSVLAAAGLGSVAARAVGWATTTVGGQYAGLINAAVVILALFMLAGTVVALIWAPSPSAALTAIVVPIVLAMVAGGFIHQVYVATTIPGQALAASVSAWLAG